jgi:hypothetical protein
MSLKKFSEFSVNESKKPKFKVGDTVEVVKDDTSDDEKRSLKIGTKHTIKSIDYMSDWLKFEDDKYFHNPENFKKIINESVNLKNTNPALWNQIQVAKKVLNTNDVMAKVMGGMTKEEARELLKKHNIKFKESKDEINELFIADGETEKDNDNIYVNKYNNRTLVLPLIPDAIKILSENKNAIKFTNKDELVKFVENQKYFSASFSHCFYDKDEYLTWSDSGNQNLSDDAKNSLMLFETEHELIMCWDERNKIGYVIPAKQQYENREEQLNHKITIETDASGADILIKMLNHIKSIGNIGHSFTIMVDPDGDKEYKKPFGWDGDGSMRIYDIKDEEIKEEDMNEFLNLSNIKTDNNLKFSEKVFYNFLNKPFLNGIISDISIYNRIDNQILQIVVEIDNNKDDKDYKFYNYIISDDIWENLDISKLSIEDKKILSDITKIINKNTKFTDVNNF